MRQSLARVMTFGMFVQQMFDAEMLQIVLMLYSTEDILLNASSHFECNIINWKEITAPIHVSFLLKDEGSRSLPKNDLFFKATCCDFIRRRIDSSDALLYYLVILVFIASISD